MVLLPQKYHVKLVRDITGMVHAKVGFSQIKIFRLHLSVKFTFQTSTFEKACSLHVFFCIYKKPHF